MSGSGLPATTAAGSRAYGLDILRACAILSVVMQHGITLITVPWLVRAVSLVNPDGVNLFFVLSGYLIGTVALKMLARPVFSIREAGIFWVRRWLRTLPTYYLMLALLFGTALLRWRPPAHVLPYILFVQNLAWPHPDFFGEAWSLSIEEWFYLLLPAFLLVCAALMPRVPRHGWVLGFALACIAAGPLIRANVALAHGFPDTLGWDLWLRKTVVTRIDAIAYGVLGAWLHLHRPQAWQSHPVVLLLAGLLLLAGGLWLPPQVLDASYMPAYMNLLALSIQPFSVLLLLPWLTRLRGGNGPVRRFFSFFAAISYPLYLVNLGLVLVTFMPRLNPECFPGPCGPASQAAVFIKFWVVSIMVAWLVHRLWEQPIMDWRDRRFRHERAD